MAAAGDGFTDRVGEAWEEQGVATTLQDDIAERLDDMKRATLARLAAFQAGINMQQSLDPAGVQALGDALLARAWSGAAGGAFTNALVDNDDFRDAVFVVVQVARSMFLDAKDVPGTPAKGTPAKANPSLVMG